MKIRDGDWGRKRPASVEDRKRELMRRAKTEAENRRNIGGVLKVPGRRSRKPITLPKTPWDDKP